MVNHSQSSNLHDLVTPQASAPAPAQVGLLDVVGHPELNKPIPGTEELYAQAQAQIQTRRAANDSNALQGKDISASLNKLSADAAQNMDSSHRSEFMGELNGFLAQAKLRNFSQEEINRTLDATAQLLEGQGEKALSQTDRVWLATTLMHNLSHPDRIDQGYHNTCNVTAVSKVLMAKDPATMAEMVSSTALNGYYQASDGKRIAIDAQSLEPDSEAVGGKTVDRKRNYANQVFDIISINNYWQRNNPPYSWVQRQPAGQGDTGERMLDAFGRAICRADGSYFDEPNLGCSAMIEIGRELGMKENFLISNVKADGDGVRVDSPDQLSQSIKGMLAEGHPAMIFVAQGNKLFTGKNGHPGQGWHVVTIDSYDAATGKFHLSNQWGAQNDQMVNIADLYDATLPESLWAKDSNYFNKQIFEARMQQMADGGAGLSNNQVLPEAQFNGFLISQKKQLQNQNLQTLLDELKNELEAARAAQNESEVKRLESWISQTREGLQ